MNRLAAWIRQLATSRPAGGTLRIESSIRLGPHHTMHAVSLGERQWVLVCHPQGALELPERAAGDRLAGAAHGGTR